MSAPAWVDTLVQRAGTTGAQWFSRFLPPEGGGRRESAVLLLLGPDGAGDARVVLTERAHAMRSHPGQVAFPGGGREDTDRDLVQTALREANEEIGLDPSTVIVLGALPTLHIPVSGYDVTPVLAWWDRPAPVWARDTAEVAQVVQPRVAQLLDPAHRFQVRHPSGYVGPAFSTDGLLVWGFTAGLLDRVLDLAGLTRPWDLADVRDLE